MMGSMTIRNIDDDVKRKLRLRAARKGVSMETEARSILRLVVVEDISLEAIDGQAKEESAWDVIKRLREKYGTFELELPERTEMAGDSLFRE